MTLNQISEQYKTTTGSDVGFMFKSLETGNEFQALSKTPSGKFLISRPGKEALVSGDVDRYEVLLGRREILQGKLAEIEAKRADIVVQIDALNAEETAIHQELIGLDE